MMGNNSFSHFFLLLLVSLSVSSSYGQQNEDTTVAQVDSTPLDDQTTTTSVSQTGDNTCASSYTYPDNQADVNSKRVLVVQIFYDAPWQCYLADPTDQRTYGLVNLLAIPRLKQIHVGSYVNDIKIRKFFNGSIGVEYEVIASRDMSDEEKGIQGNAIASADKSVLRFCDPTNPTDCLSVSGHPRHVYIKDGRETTAPIYDSCFYYSEIQICENDGVCVDVDGQPKCLCHQDYADDKYCRDDDRVYLIILIVLGVVALVFAVCLCVCCCVKEREKINRGERKSLKKQQMVSALPTKQPIPVAQPSPMVIRQERADPYNYVPIPNRTQTLESNSKSVKVFQPVNYVHTRYAPNYQIGAPQQAVPQNLTPMQIVGNRPPNATLPGNQVYRISRMSTGSNPNYNWNKV